MHNADDDDTGSHMDDDGREFRGGSDGSVQAEPIEVRYLSQVILLKSVVGTFVNVCILTDVKKCLFHHSARVFCRNCLRSQYTSIFILRALILLLCIRPHFLVYLIPLLPIFHTFFPFLFLSQFPLVS